MKYISEKEYNNNLKQINKENESLKRLKSLREEQNKYRPKIKLPSTSKLMAVYLFVILNIVLIYAIVSMYKLADLTYLGTLVTDVAAQILTYFIYSKKALAENSQGGITYDMAMMNYRSENVIENDETDEEAVG